MTGEETQLEGGLAYENFVAILKSLQQDKARLAWEKYRAPSIRDALAPDKSYQSDTAIVLPECNEKGRDALFKLAPLIEQNQFHGMTSENPLDHIREFEENCSMTDFPVEYVRMFLFPKSLSGKSKAWFKGLPVNSLKTWEQCRSTFLNHFYTPGKTASFRDRIQNYSQRIGESFYETWERFKELKIDCPHHGFSEEQLLLYFYKGLEEVHKGVLDVASGGNFTTQSVEGAYDLIGNMAASSYNKDIEYDRTTRKESPTKRSKNLSSVSKKLTDNQETARPTSVFSIQHASEEASYEQEISEPRATFDQDYRNPHVANPEDQFYPSICTWIRPNLDQFDRIDHDELEMVQEVEEEDGLDSLRELILGAIGGYQMDMTEIRFTLSDMSEEVGGKVEILTTRVIALECETENWKLACAIALRSGKVTESPPDPRRGKEQEGVVDLEEGTSGEMPREIPAPIERRLEPEQPTEPTQEPARGVPSVPRQTPVTKLPYPKPPKKSLKELEDAKCKEMLADIEVKMTISEAMHLIPALKRYIKALATSRLTDKGDFIRLTRECSAICQQGAIRKMEDPGKFVLSVVINFVTFPRSLCDLGSSVNLMPYSVAKRLGLTGFRKTEISLVFADRSVKKPVGILDDVKVTIGGIVLLSDFVVLEMDHEPKDPLILGRPFLCTAGAVIDVKKGKIDLCLGDITVSFEMGELLQRPMIEGQAFLVRDTLDDLDETIDWLMQDPLELAMTGGGDEDEDMGKEVREYLRMLDSTPACEEEKPYEA